jgi:lipopolysaccharide biosynthesis protein
VRAVAFHLPQYHPIPENDEWWGVGFTEWANVTRARPLFRWHHQPHLPADLGFYDLRLPEARAAQAELARDYGIHGFCFYHYWFNGRRLLERPVDDILASGEPDIPFCLCWANENWTRAWDGGERHVLMEQRYSVDDDRRHIRWLCRAFADRRYIRVCGKPVFLVYRVSRFPDPRRTAETWRIEAERAGIGEIYLCHMQSFASEHRDPAEFGFDAAVEFQPDWKTLGPAKHRTKTWHWLRRLRLAPRAYGRARVYDYAAMVRRMLAKPQADYTCFPAVTPMWDNSPRRKSDCVIVRGSTPQLYEQWLRRTVQERLPRGAEEDLVFINAWNEWGEGNHLEPCQRWGRQYLEATQRALEQAAVCQKSDAGRGSPRKFAMSEAGT